MRIVTVRIDSRGQTMELKGTEAYIGYSVSDFLIREFDNLIKELADAPHNAGVINIDIVVGGDF